jgi:hypothetical protein
MTSALPDVEIEQDEGHPKATHMTASELRNVLKQQVLQKTGA